MHRQRRLVRGLLSNSSSQMLGCRPFFGMSGRGSGGAGGRGDSGKEGEVGGKGWSGLFSGAGGLPPGFDEQRLKAVQEIFNKQSPEKQAELMKKALEFQKVFGKVPGIGKMAQKNIEMLEKVVINNSSQQQQQTPPKANGIRSMSGAAERENKAKIKSSNESTAAGSARISGGAAGPTIDELKKINLGPEIEELFAELSSIRAKKNSYRSKFLAAETDLEKLRKEVEQLRETDASLRSKLRRVEQDVMLLNSENMELKEHEKEWRQVRHKNEKLTDAVQRLQHDNAAQDRQLSEALQVQLKEKDDMLRSLQRKLDRLRKRDPLLQFSLLCSDVARLCDTEQNAAKDAAEDAFNMLQGIHQQKQDAAWKSAMLQDGAAAKAFMAVVRRFYLSRVPHANYDALVAVDDAEALRPLVSEMGFTLEHVAAGRYVIVAPSVEVPKTFIGPYGLCAALYLAGKSVEGEKMFSFKLTVVYPHVSSTLFGNTCRTGVQYDTARSSGPGGQAVNVSETQIIAKLSIDGDAAYTAEAQDSRSALNNREAATEKLAKTRRQHYNEQLAKQHKPEGLERELVAVVQSTLNGNGSSGSDGMVGPVPKEIVELVNDTVAKKLLPGAELGLLYGMLYLFREAAAAASS
ncbi:hypothetical protein, conserved [Trypanosoma brucei brucei TREU927]|uniref:Prokaryotic-type class I peptide chain release factors domain-containing protein n=1 Tax=Trypanosoma brucei brucei (strain 927/4 GUTat10.1) TaxID=185431 RepID=Q38CG3_TRYB2|nr:hypothetical protein, conserved [Trypanosoma brucei brucei TREU927]EAN77507.1 hypothetical protein, conserved [Trypanosoma brucei brucei TREU927]